MTNRPPLSLVLLALALFLAPIIGGQLAVEAQPLGPGLADLISALMGGPEVPTLTHALLAALTLIGLATVVVRRQVLQTPNAKVILPLLVFVGFVVASVSVSRFKSISLVSMLEWTSYAASFVAAVAISGRKSGPSILLIALVAGCTVVAIKGVSEYAGMRHIDPTWRVFADWVNQNALSGMLMLGLFPAIALAIRSERIPRMVALIAATLIGFCLVLAQSKGGLIATGFGLCVFVALGAWATGVRRVSLAFVPLVLVIVLAVGLQTSQKTASGPGIFNRVTQASGTEQQSFGFRRLLWQGALAMVRQNPIGTGIGVYRFSSAQPGLTQQTHLTHNSYLQLAVETSPLGMMSFVAFLGAWCLVGMQGLRKHRPDMAILRVAIVASASASFAHNLVDSDLYHFGIGLTLFVLLGVGLQLAPDGSGPEFVPRPIRWGSMIACCAAIPLAMVLLGSVEATKAHLIGAAVRQDLEGVTRYRETLESWASYDGEAWYLRSAYSPDSQSPEARIRYLKEAVALGPSSKISRALARAYLEAGMPASAISWLTSALRYDPNNLVTLSQLMRVYEEIGDPDRAADIARRMIALEGTPYLKIRAIPEMIPTEPYEARLFLAKSEQDKAKRAELLRAAVDGFVSYAQVTVPRVKEAAKTDPPSSYAGESLAEAQQKLDLARNAARDLAALYRELGRSSEAVAVEVESAALTEG